MKQAFSAKNAACTATVGVIDVIHYVTEIQS